MTAPLPAAITRLLHHVELPLESARLCDIEWAWEDYIAPALNALPDFIDSLDVLVKAAEAFFAADPHAYEGTPLDVRLRDLRAAIASLTPPMEPEPAVPQPRQTPAPDSARVYGGGMRL